MAKTETVGRYLEALLNGDRKNTRAVIEEVLQTGTPTNLVYMEVVWPAMVEIEKLQRAERITPAQEHIATRINRTIVDQLQNKLPRRPAKDKKIVVCCAPEPMRAWIANSSSVGPRSVRWTVKLQPNCSHSARNAAR